MTRRRSTEDADARRPAARPPGLRWRPPDTPEQAALRQTLGEWLCDLLRAHAAKHPEGPQEADLQGDLADRLVKLRGTAPLRDGRRRQGGHRA